MGYSNVGHVYGLASEGRLTKPRGGKTTLNTMALNVLTYMSYSTYDWPPTDKIRRLGLPCRYYALGWRSIAEHFGMMLLSDEQTSDPDADADAMMDARTATARSRITQAWRYLRDQNLIKELQPASLGKNAGYLLLLGDDEENNEVEDWARECLGLPWRK
ncbi:hypothetical protein EM849_03725 [Bifidobacterium tissieri]|nr:hypothetical protein EM849_03725 [Bifidobacterium tissieri]